MNTPILFIIFNKIDETKRVFNAIKQQKPKKLFIAADGPRPSKPGERKKCNLIRQWVLENIDWNCEVKTLFRQENVGCGRGVSDAIFWFFEYVEEGIILEDDCLPNDSFFRFCEENLEKYRTNHRISIISGNNFQLIQPMKMEEGYYFSVFPSTWGWATWKRSWIGYQYIIPIWKYMEQAELSKFLFEEIRYSKWWINKLKLMYDENTLDDAWDFQFYFHSMKQKRLAITPRANLVSNIGHGDIATHTTGHGGYFDNMPTYEMTFPLKHPSEIERNYDADVFVQKMLFGEAEIVSPWKKFKRIVKKAINYKQ